MRRAWAIDSIRVLWLRITRRCPTCGERGPDTIHRVGDYGGDLFEARCGDGWHDGKEGDIPCPVAGGFPCGASACSRNGCIEARRHG